MHDDDIVDTTEMYLKAVLELEEEGVPALRARLADRFDHRTPTVSKTVERLTRHGLVDLESDRQLSFTPRGRATAAAVMRKHRITEVFLDRVVGLEWEYLHEEACRWEHVMSDRVEQLLDELLEHPQFTPYGNPIDPAHARRDGDVNLVRATVGSGGSLRATVSWIGEPLQADPGALASLRANGLVPGVTADFSTHSPGVILAVTEEGRIELPHALAVHLFVTLADGVVLDAGAAHPLRPSRQ